MTEILKTEKVSWVRSQIIGENSKHADRWVGRPQRDQIGLFLKGQVADFVTNVAQIFGNFLGYFEKYNGLFTTAVATFKVTLWEN